MSIRVGGLTSDLMTRSMLLDTCVIQWTLAQ